MAVILYEVMDTKGESPLGLFERIDVAKQSMRISWHKHKNVSVEYNGRCIVVKGDDMDTREYAVREVIQQPEHL